MKKREPNQILFFFVSHISLDPLSYKRSAAKIMRITKTDERTDTDPFGSVGLGVGVEFPTFGTGVDVIVGMVVGAVYDCFATLWRPVSTKFADEPNENVRLVFNVPVMLTQMLLRVGCALLRLFRNVTAKALLAGSNW